jgi:hypothetical protein
MSACEMTDKSPELCALDGIPSPSLCADFKTKRRQKRRGSISVGGPVLEICCGGVESAPIMPPTTYRLEGVGALDPCLRHCRLTVNPSDHNSTGRSLVGTSWGVGEGWEELGDRDVGGVPCRMAGGIPGHLQHTRHPLRSGYATCF